MQNQDKAEKLRTSIESEIVRLQSLSDSFQPIKDALNLILQGLDRDNDVFRKLTSEALASYMMLDETSKQAIETLSALLKAITPKKNDIDWESRKV